MLQECLVRSFGRLCSGPLNKRQRSQEHWPTPVSMRMQMMSDLDDMNTAVPRGAFLARWPTTRPTHVHRSHGFSQARLELNIQHVRKTVPTLSRCPQTSYTLENGTRRPYKKRYDMLRLYPLSEVLTGRLWVLVVHPIVHILWDTLGIYQDPPRGALSGSL